MTVARDHGKRHVRHHVAVGAGCVFDMGRMLLLYVRWWLARLASRSCGKLLHCGVEFRPAIFVVVEIALFVVVVVVGVGGMSVPLGILVVVLVPTVIELVRLLVHYRKVVIVEGFLDCTDGNVAATRGLAPLLVVELARLQELFRRNEIDRSILAVGGEFGKLREAADFLTAGAEGLERVLENPVASGAEAQVGPVKLPIGVMLSLLNRLASGPRVLGSVYETTAGGGPTLTVQLVGGRAPVRSWRIDGRSDSESTTMPGLFDKMVCELAYRMFTDLAVAGSTEWKAVRAFAEYLRLYGESDQACSLKEARDRLREAISADQSFGLAYYNLGVIYGQLAQAGSTAEPASQDMTRPREVAPATLARERREAARVAFWQATVKAPSLWQGHYALALAQFTAIPPIRIDGSLPESDARRERLEEVIRGCKQALRLRPPLGSRAVVQDLLGKALARLAERTDDDCYLRDGMGAFRRAVSLSQRELCGTERRWYARRAAGHGHPERLEQARDNATVAVHDLALAHARRAILVVRRSPCDWMIAEHLFRIAAQQVRPCVEGELSSHSDRGLVLEHKGDVLRDKGEVLHHNGGKRAQHRNSKTPGFRRAAHAYKEAANAYEEASHLKPTNAAYAAKQARALAKAEAVRPTNPDNVKIQIDRQARKTLRELAPAFRYSTPSAIQARSRKDAQRPQEEIVQVLSEAYTELARAYKAKSDSYSECVEELGKLFAAVETPWNYVQDAHFLLAETTRDKAGGHESLSSRKKRLFSREERLSEQITVLNRTRDGWVQTCEKRLGELRLHRQPTSRGLKDFDLVNQCRDLVLDQIDMCVAQLSAACWDWAVAEKTLGRLIGELEDRGRRGGTDAERIVDFHLRAEHARALRHCNCRKEALYEIVDCLQANPLSVEGRREAGKIHYSLGQYNEALRSWKLALSLDPNDAYAHLNMAVCYRQLAMCYPSDAYAAQQTDNGRKQALLQAAEHLRIAFKLFRGEDVFGSMWARVWSGRVSLDRGLVGECVAELTGALHDALDGSASAAAWLFLGETRLADREVGLAECAFKRCDETVRNLDADASAASPSWGFQLPNSVVKYRLECGFAMCCLERSSSPTEADLHGVDQHLKNAETARNTLSLRAEGSALGANLPDSLEQFECDALINKVRWRLSVRSLDRLAGL